MLPLRRLTVRENYLGGRDFLFGVKGQLIRVVTVLQMMYTN